MPVEALALTNMDGNTPLQLAASIGNTKATAMLAGKHPPSLYIGASVFLYSDNMLPIHCAALYGRRDTLLCLLDVTNDDQVAVNERCCALFVHCLISSEFFDIALKWVEKYPRLAIQEFDRHGSALEAMAWKCSAFKSGRQRQPNFWQRIIYHYVPVKLDKCSVKDQNKRDDVEMRIPQVTSSHVQEDNWAQSCGKNISIFGHPVSQNLQATLWKVLEFSVPQIKHIRKEKLRHVQALQLVKTLCEKITHYDGVAYDNVAGNAMDIAIQKGVPEIIEEIADRFPSLIWKTNEDGQNLFHQAIANRDEKVFNLIYQMSDQRYIATNIIDYRGDNILHMAGRLAPPKKLSLAAGPVLQMQRELQWFEEVKKFVHPGSREFRNSVGETPEMVFAKEHMALVAEGGKWMKEIASSCTVPAALVVTIVFAAAITVPGGNSGNTGLPLFYQKVAFIIFAVSNAFSLFMSATSLLMFLSLLNFRYEERDFLYILPSRLIILLVTPFLSITAMMVAFSCTLYLVSGQNKAWILIPVAALACLPITSFVPLQFPLLVALISSTFGSGIFGKQSDRMLH